MTQYDLTTKILPYLDRHLGFPMLLNESLEKLYKPEEVLAATYDLAKETDLVDFSLGLWNRLHPDQEPPAEFSVKRAKTLENIEKLEKEAHTISEAIENPEFVQAIRADKLENLKYLQDKFKITLEQLEALYNFGQLQYSIGNYSVAADYLYHFRILSTNPALILSAQWGKLACDLLVGNWDTALEELQSLKEAIDTASSATLGGSSALALSQLQSRTWLLHWSLFVYFQHPEGRTHLLELFLSTAYLNTIQTSCPWILRYLASAAILSRKSLSSPSSSASRALRGSLQTIVKILQTEAYQYEDPITKFLTELYGDFDFEGAQKWLSEAETVLAGDFFLNDFKDEFLENARFIVSEAYIRIHQKIDIADLSATLKLSQSEGEKWIVNLIRETRMGAEAKIDLEKNIVTTQRSQPPVYQSIIEKTRGLARRTQDLAIDINRRAFGEGGGEGQGQRGGQEKEKRAPAAAPPPAATAVPVR
ncbi:eukaryotic translation initiation factor 3, subunit 6 [Clavulina sp. PMI_390]|nr:eukaryotic translation initiation factor 3, subunit 6 [Clavulina sp. PMI_390]